MDGSSFDFYSVNKKRNKYSLALLAGGHSRQLSRSADVTKMATIHRGALVTELLLAVLAEHPDLGLVIVGNHDVKEKDELNITELGQGSGDLKDIDSHVVVPLDDRNVDTETTWTRERAQFIREQFFRDSRLVGFGSVEDYNQRDFLYTPLRKLGHDAVGILITFDFRKTLDDRQKRDASKPHKAAKKSKDNTQYRSVRFL